MVKLLLIEEFHVSVRMPADKPDATYVRARRTLDSRQFQELMRKVVNDLFRRHASLKSVRCQVSV